MFESLINWILKAATIGFTAFILFVGIAVLIVAIFYGAYAIWHALNGYTEE